MRGVRLWEVKNAVFERRNRRDHSLCPLMGGVRLREVSLSGGSTVFVWGSNALQLAFTLAFLSSVWTLNPEQTPKKLFAGLV